MPRFLDKAGRLTWPLESEPFIPPRAVLRVAYYYHQGERLPADHPKNNPYGELLCSALERRGVEVEFEVDYSLDYLERNRGRIDVLHHNWPHHDYYHDDRAVMVRQMRDFVRSLETARELGYKVVWTAHNVYPHNRTHQDIDHEFRLELCRLSTAVIAHCEVAARTVNERFGPIQNLFLIPHGNFIGVHSSDLTREQARAQLGIPLDAFVYGFFGSFQPYKGVEGLIDTLRSLPQEDSWLLAAGGGRQPYLDSVVRYVRNHPRILLRTYPRAPNEDLFLVLRGVDVMVLPFVATMTSGSLILALSWGKPVIAPASGCLPTTVREDAGILYDPDQEDGLFQAMQQIRGWDLEKTSKMATASVRRFAWEDIAEQTLEAYRV